MLFHKSENGILVVHDRYLPKIGLGIAIEYALQLGLPQIWDRIQFLASYLRNNLANIPSIKLHDLGEKKCGIVTFTSQNRTVDEILKQLNLKKINVSISRQEYARLDLAKRNLSALVRASVHYYNTEEEIDILCQALI